MPGKWNWRRSSILAPPIKRGIPYVRITSRPCQSKKYSRQQNRCRIKPVLLHLLRSIPNLVGSHRGAITGCADMNPRYQTPSLRWPSIPPPRPHSASPPFLPSSSPYSCYLTAEEQDYCSASDSCTGRRGPINFLRLPVLSGWSRTDERFSHSSSPPSHNPPGH